MTQNNNETPINPQSTAVDEKQIQFAVEVWRLAKLTNKMLSKIDLDEQRKYVGQLDWFNKKATEFFQAQGITFANFQVGMPFDAGMPLNPVNIGDFNAEDELYIEQLLEPVILYEGKVVKQGTVVLGKR